MCIWKENLLELTLKLTVTGTVDKEWNLLTFCNIAGSTLLLYIFNLEDPIYIRPEGSPYSITH